MPLLNHNMVLRGTIFVTYRNEMSNVLNEMIPFYSFQYPTASMVTVVFDTVYNIRYTPTRIRNSLRAASFLQPGG